jgi:hypothetical protein
VSVLVIDCTTTGASEPTRMPPTTAVTVFLRGIIAMGAFILALGREVNVSGCSMLVEKFTVRTHTNKLQNLRIPLAVDQQQVRLQVAFAMVAVNEGLRHRPWF